ncbi:hypothetical protein LEP1GSC008_3482 [Leptospira kirschneri serovar Bulgarica str. Nikolaevo]|uniref:Uncharacterized protein n=1 Tax=Leptospira kirschneri serovar Bulgarica str. Nikolaevo TaxID=1240687 RepID=M6FE06_9LEPT|nr:hypothetical protein LEP1GSC008_0076 [Leptospira kirschneri serovar Bulgarica str. Nikolaevo]EMK25322.1 hypothetical protein LEP1GSC008_3482 [Leptospira kirschneri serovar Bulgarica str. Nikolaevo]
MDLTKISSLKSILQGFRNTFISNRLCLKNLCFKIEMKKESKFSN